MVLVNAITIVLRRAQLTIRRLLQAWQLCRRFGVGWVSYRALYAFRLRSGLMRLQMPAYAWTDRPLATWLLPGIPSDPVEYARWRSEHAPHFFFERLPELAGVENSQSIIAEADLVLNGQWRYFSHTVYDVGFPPDWHSDPLSGRRWPEKAHWSNIGDFDFVSSDIKLVWEANRFGAVYPLVRTYAYMHDERYSSAFWQLVENWRDRNPPMRGPNWKCGQEATFRVMAWCFGLYAFRDSLQTTPERIAMLTAMIMAHGTRIAGNIRYAVSQHNNHSLSEGVGLWTIGLLFPEFRSAANWQARGKQIIESELARQIESSGAHSQRSANYARLVLQMAVWALRLGELNDQRFSPQTYERVARLTDWLFTLIDPENGQTPNYGANDGALIPSLDSCDYTDFRPTLQVGYWLTHGKRLFPQGAWDEPLAWLFDLQRQDAPSAQPQPEKRAENSAIYSLHSDHSRAFLYCTRYRERPGHADQLHVDLWWRGINIACDAGTYLYNGDPRWQNALSSTAVHNTVTVDGRDQMTGAGRFLWLDWVDATLESRTDKAVVASHRGYAPVIHQRTVRALGDDRWEIVDSLSGDEHPHCYRLHWLLADAPYEWDTKTGRLTLHYPVGDYSVEISTDPFNPKAELSLVRADPNSIRGWRSIYYAERLPVLSLVLAIHSPKVIFITRFMPSAANQPYPIRFERWLRRLCGRGTGG